MRALVLGIVAVLTLAAIPAAAQNRGQNQQPAGSFRQSCSNIQVNGGGANASLTATCLDMAGRPRVSSLAYARCQGDISNNNGVLVCAGAPPARAGNDGYDQGRGRGQQTGLPAGPYRQSCDEAWIEGSGQQARLNATCRDYNGRSRTSSLLYRQCRDEITTDSGILTCYGAPRASVDDYGPGRGRGQGQGRGQGDQYGETPTDGLPAGNWRQTCSERRIERVWVKAQCLNSAGRRVLAEANWEQCPSFSFSNINGRLDCDAGGSGRGGGRPGVPGGGRAGSDLPGGPWRQTCQDIGLAQGNTIISAQCRDERGGLRATSIDMRGCPYFTLRNERGYLRCAQ